MTVDELHISATLRDVIINVHGGIVQDVFLADPSQHVILIDSDVDQDDCHPDIVQITQIMDRGYCAYIVAVQPHALDALVGTDCAAAIDAANVISR